MKRQKTYSEELLMIRIRTHIGSKRIIDWMLFICSHFSTKRQRFPEYIDHTVVLTKFYMNVEFSLMHLMSYSSGRILISSSIQLELNSLIKRLYWKIYHFMNKSPSHLLLLILKFPFVLNYIVKLLQILLVDICKELVQDTVHFPYKLEDNPWIGGNKPLI